MTRTFKVTASRSRGRKTFRASQPPLEVVPDDARNITEQQITESDADWLEAQGAGRYQDDAES